MAFPTDLTSRRGLPFAALDWVAKCQPDRFVGRAGIWRHFAVTQMDTTADEASSFRIIDGTSCFGSFIAGGAELAWAWFADSGAASRADAKRFHLLSRIAVELAMATPAIKASGWQRFESFATVLHTRKASQDRARLAERALHP